MPPKNAGFMILMGRGGAPRVCAALVMAAGVGVGLVSCHPGTRAAGDGSQSVATSGPLAEGDAFRALKQLAQRQRTAPDAAARRLDPPPGVPGANVEPVREADAEHARLTKAEVLAKFQTEASGAAPVSAPEKQPAPALANPRALQLYIAGRTKVLNGQAAQGVTDLEAASRLDPNAPEVWRELGSAQMDLGRRTSAMASFQRAVKLGMSDARVTVLLAREDLRAKRYEEAARKLALAARSPTIDREPGLPQLVSIDLADAVQPLGYLTAARDLLAAGLEDPIGAIGASPLRNELAEVMRRRGDLWQRVGDLSCRLGDFAGASAAYARAAEAPGLDPQGLIARRVFASLRQGQSAEAALVVVDDIVASQGRVEDRHMGVISLLAGQTAAGPALAEALADVARVTAATATPTTLNRLARASAAALLGEPARAVLRARLAQNPGDADLVLELLSTHADADVQGRAKECVLLTEASPLDAGLYAGAILSRGQGIDETARVLARDSSPGARLLHAALVSRLGRPDMALSTLAASFPGRYQAAALAATVASQTASGQWPQAAATFDRLDALTTPEARRAQVQALQALQRFDVALARMETLITEAGPAATTDDLLLAAEMAANSDNAPKTESYLQRAIARDRFDERPYEPLISLYAPSGSLHDEAKLTALARDLRQNIPSSRVIRAIAAQDLVSRSLWSQAEPQLTGMLTPGNENSAILNMLVAVWEREAATDSAALTRAEALLRERLATRPQQSLLLGALARVLAAGGRGQEGIDLMMPRLEAWPLPELARTREWIVREKLSQPDEADRLAKARLEAAPPSIDNSIERAELLARTGDVDAAAAALLAGVPTSATLTDAQAARLLSTIARIKPDEMARANPGSIDAAIHLLDLISSRGQTSTQLRVARLTLVAIGHPDDTDRLVSGVEEIGAKEPEALLPAYAHIAAELGKRSDAGPALRFLGAAARRVTPVSEPLYFAWFSQTALRGSAADIDTFADSLTDSEGAAAILGFIQRNSPGIPEQVPTDADERRSEVLYQLGLFLTSGGRDELSERAYRACLKIRPTHTWANNNLGYELLLKGRLDEAQPMIETAYEQMPDNANIVDTMGWLLYKRGQLADIKNEDGSVQKEGAVTLLSMAAGNDPSAAVLDHAADALWRAGGADQKDQARQLWSQAELLLRAEIADPQTNPALRKRNQPLLESLSAKVKAVQAGDKPEIAPLHDPASAAAPPDTASDKH